MAGYVGGDHPTTLLDYPSPQNQWFKYVHYDIKDLEMVKDVVTDKGDDDLINNPQKIETRTNKLSSVGDNKEQKKKLQMEIDVLNEEIEQIEDGTWLLEPFANIPGSQLPPAPLWPYSPLDKVLDHDPVMSKIKVILKQTGPHTQDNISATSGKRVTRSNQ